MIDTLHCNGGINFHFLFCSNVRLYKEAGLFITFPMPVNRNHHFSFTADSCLQIYKFYRVSKEEKKKMVRTRPLLIHISWSIG
jgi:hypothetical protein